MSEQENLSEDKGRVELSMSKERKRLRERTRER